MTEHARKRLGLSSNAVPLLSYRRPPRAWKWRRWVAAGLIAGLFALASRSLLRVRQAGDGGGGLD